MYKLHRKKDKSEFTDEIIWNYLHARISGSSCTIVLLTKDLMDRNKNRYKIECDRGNFLNFGWVYNEISASLRDWKNNRLNGIVCVVVDELWDRINWNKSENGSGWTTWNSKHDLPEILAKNKEYIIFTRYSSFINDHLKFIQLAIDNRNKQIKSSGNYFKIKYDLHNETKLFWW